MFFRSSSACSLGESASMVFCSRYTRHRYFMAAPGFSGGEGHHLLGERLREARPCLAPLLVGDQARLLLQQVRVAEDSEDGRHEDVGRGEGSDQMITAVDAGSELGETRPHRLDRSWPPF